MSIPPSADQADLSLGLHDRLAFGLGVVWIYGLGALLRVSQFADPRIGLLYSVMVDTVVVALILLGRALHRWAWPRLSRASLAALVVISAVVGTVGVLQAISLFGLIDPALQAPYTANRPAQIYYYLLTFLSWGGAGAWLRSRAAATHALLRAVAAERTARDAEMRRLRMQVDSHFLFNALNAVAVEVQDNPRRALRLVREMSQYLRYSLDTANASLVTVSAEIAALRSFLGVQKFRFGSRLTFKVQQQGATRGFLIPAFLIQPLVDNAAKHGVASDDGVLHIGVSVTMVDGMLRIEVTNSGDLVRPARHPGTGTGLTNLAQRLELHFPRQHRFALRQDEEVVRAVLELELSR